MFGKKKKQPQDESLYHCSFCHKSQRDVARLIQGPNVFICDECVEICWEIVADLYVPDDPEAPHSTSGIIGICAICRLPASMDDALAVPDRGIVCRGCRSAIEAAIAAETAPPE